MNTAIRQKPGLLVAVLGSYVTSNLDSVRRYQSNEEIGHATLAYKDRAWCEAANSKGPNYHNHGESNNVPPPSQASWIRRKLLAPIGIPLPTPRILLPNDPALNLSKRFIQRRAKDEDRMRQLLAKAPTLGGDPNKIKALSEQIFEVTYGKGVTAQAREDFLLQYGCSGWTDQVLEPIVQLSESRGIVEMGAGHGQWARAISEYHAKQNTPAAGGGGGKEQTSRKRFDFVLAYDDMSNLPLNTHIYNAYTQPHHDYFGNVHKLETKNDMGKVLKSWHCRGRVLLLVYPPPGDMAMEVVRNYVDAAPENDTVVLVAEGRGGANGDDALFDYFTNGDWILVQTMDVKRPPGDKGYEKLFILQKTKQRENVES